MLDRRTAADLKSAHMKDSGDSRQTFTTSSPKNKIGDEISHFRFRSLFHQSEFDYFLFIIFEFLKVKATDNGNWKGIKINDR